VWPHGDLPVEQATLANITAFVFLGGSNPVPCQWDKNIWLWVALNNQPAHPLKIGQRRLMTVGGYTIPVWDFNDIDVHEAQDPDNKLYFFATVEGIPTYHNIWIHGREPRSIVPQQDIPTGLTRTIPTEVDARIEIVWPHGGLPVDQATRANITAFLFVHGTTVAIDPALGWQPTVKLHWALNNGSDGAAGGGMQVGTPRLVTQGGVTYQVWDFNDIDVSAARNPLNKLHFWVEVEGVKTYPNIWTHGADARTIFPQTDTPTRSCTP